MAQGVYSTTFVRNNTKDLWAIYTVPAGYRAVVKCITGMCGATFTGNVQIQVGGIYVYIRTFPAASSAWVQELMAVAYAGEEVRSFHNGVAHYSTVSGYLLRETLTTPRTGPQEEAHLVDEWDGVPL